MTPQPNILAVVPARSGSKGIPDKNMQRIGGVSLIALAAQCLAACPSVRRSIISTDSPAYAKEAESHGLAAPFLRPPELAGDHIGAVETMQHAWQAAEAHYGERYDLLLIIEPTCPLRRTADIEGCIDLLRATAADSVVAVSPVDSKFHPRKILSVDDGKLGFYDASGAEVKTRQSLSPLLYRNGACYAVTRSLLLEEGKIFGADTRPYVIERPLANIDSAEDLLWAEFLLQRDLSSPR